MNKVNIVFNKLIGAKGNIYPSSHFIEIVELIKSKKENLKIAEIGVDKGATTKAILKIIGEGDQYDLFDVETCPFFKSGKIKTDAKIIIHSNTTRIFDSYAWEISKLLINNYKNKEKQLLWDAVYLDGAHRFHVDAPTTAFLKEMINIEGYIIFDDMNWTLGKSPTCNNEFNWNSFTKEQMENSHVGLIVDALVKYDNRFVEIESDDKSRAIFKKISN